MKKKTICLRGALFAGVLLFSAVFIFPGCKKIMDGNAGGSLHDDKGCIPAVVHGTWYAGIVPDPDTNYVEIGVNVTRPGRYRIVSDRNNGVVLGDSGIFFRTGINKVRLHAQGTFTDALTTAFTLVFDSSICGYLVDVHSTSPTYNAWKFTAGGHVYSGTSDASLYGIPQSQG